MRFIYDGTMVSRRRDQYVLDRLLLVPTTRPPDPAAGALTYPGTALPFYWLTADGEPGVYWIQGDDLWLGCDATNLLPPESVAAGTPITLTWSGGYALPTLITSWQENSERQYWATLATVPDEDQARGELVVTGLMRREKAGVKVWCARFDYQGRDSLVVNENLRVEVSRSRFVVRSFGAGGKVSVGDEFQDDEGCDVTVENVAQIGRTHKELSVRRIR